MTDIIVYGRGKTGLALANLAKKLGLPPVFYDDEKGFDCNEKFSHGSVVVKSPGVKPFAKGIVEAQKAGAKIVGELDFCFPLCRGKCVSVTGTNGKTTVCEMIRHILSREGKSNFLLGNGGIPFAQHVLDVKEDDTVVLESSSFQLEGANKFSPYISVLTNVAPDHLDYHGTFKNYCKAKTNNFRLQREKDFSIFNADDNGALQMSFESPAYTLYYSTKNPNANCYYGNGEVCLNVRGKVVNYRCAFNMTEYNLSNAMCAVLVCFLLGVGVEDSCRHLQTYSFLPHRNTVVERFDGVTFVDDSKATNVHATLSALKCYANTPVALIVGGFDKGENFDRLFDGVSPNVKVVCAVGQTAEKIFNCGKKHFCNVKICKDYRQAVKLCYRAMLPTGGTVLMSNACASFDSFENYACRGEYFCRIVGELHSEKI